MTKIDHVSAYNFHVIIRKIKGVDNFLSNPTYISERSLLFSVFCIFKYLSIIYFFPRVKIRTLSDGSDIFLVGILIPRNCEPSSIFSTRVYNVNSFDHTLLVLILLLLNRVSTKILFPHQLQPD